MYFKFYKLQSWVKRSAVRRRRFDQRFLKLTGTPLGVSVFPYLSLLYDANINILDTTPTTNYTIIV